MRYLSVMLLVVFAVLCVQGNIVIAEEAPEYTAYTDSEHGFCINTPKGWTPAALRSKEIVFKVVAVPDNDPINALNIQMIPVSFKDVEEPKVAIDLVAAQLLNSFSVVKNNKVIADNYKTVNAQEIREIVVGYTLEEKQIKQAHALLYHKYNVYIIAYTAESKALNNDIFVKAIETFEFTK